MLMPVEQVAVSRIALGAFSAVIGSNLIDAGGSFQAVANITDGFLAEGGFTHWSPEPGKPSMHTPPPMTTPDRFESQVRSADAIALMCLSTCRVFSCQRLQFHTTSRSCLSISTVFPELKRKWQMSLQIVAVE